MPASDLEILLTRLKKAIYGNFDLKRNSALLELVSFLTSDHHFSGTCPVTQECISIKECPYTKELFARVKSTSDNTERAQLIQALRLRVCGKPSDRTVCCTSLGQSIYCFSFYFGSLRCISKAGIGKSPAFRVTSP